MELSLLADDLHVRAAQLEGIRDDLEAFAIGLHLRVVAAEVRAYGEQRDRAAGLRYDPAKEAAR